MKQNTEAAKPIICSFCGADTGRTTDEYTDSIMCWKCFKRIR